jgi:O-antigen ligase
VALFFWVGAFFHGYFYELEFISAGLLILTALCVRLIQLREVRLYRLHLIIALYVGTHWITLFYAADIEQALLEALKVTCLLPLSLWITMLREDQLLRMYKQWVSMAAALVVIAIAMRMSSESRLEATFEYANVFAAFLMVTGFISLLIYVKERRLLYLLLTAIIETGILLTFTRTVWILWLLLLIAMFIVYPEMRRKAAVLPIGCVQLLGLTAVWVVNLDFQSFIHRILSIGFQASELQDRYVYWLDASRIVKDYWLGGTGGGGWRLLLSQYRPDSYFVSYVHNHYLQTLLDVGIVGLIFFLLLAGLFYYQAWKTIRSGDPERAFWAKGLLLLVSAVLLHASLDITFSFLFFFAVFCGLIAFTAINDKPIVFSLTPIRRFGVISPILIGLLCSAWMVVGYAEKQVGQKQSLLGLTDTAQTHFERAAAIIPWSSTVRYESAKSYVRQGNASGNHQYYQLAKSRLLEAIELSPQESLYHSLLENIKEAGF